MRSYHIGDRLLFIADLETYHIRKGDVAEIKTQSVTGWGIRFDHNVEGHDCDVPFLIPYGYGWWFSNGMLDVYTELIDDFCEADIMSVDLEEVL